MIKGEPPADSNRFMEAKLSNTYPLLDVCDWYCSILNQNSILEENVRKIADVYNTRNVDQFKWKSWSLRPVAVCNVLNTEKMKKHYYNTMTVTNIYLCNEIWRTLWYRYDVCSKKKNYATQIKSTWVKEDSS